MSDQFTSSQPTRYSLHHSYIWLSALRALPYIFAAVLFSSLSALFELADYVAALVGLEGLAFLFVVAFCLLFYGDYWCDCCGCCSSCLSI